MAVITLNVTTTDDQNDGFFLENVDPNVDPNDGSRLSLREAILKANADPTNEYIINLPTGIYNLDLKNILDAPIVDVSSIDVPTLIESRLTTGDLDVKGNVTIIGEDPENTIIDASNLKNTFQARLVPSDPQVAPLAGGEDDPIPTPNTSPFTISDRVFDVASGATLQLENVTIKNGLLVTETEVILNVKDGETYTRTSSEDRPVEKEILDENGNPTGETEIVIETVTTTETFQLFGVITQEDIDEGGTISFGNFDTTPQGAGIKVDQGGSVVLDNVIVENNSSASTGGGIYSDGNLNIKDSTIQNNSSSTGGGIYSDGNLTINRTTIQSNSSGKGTGIHNVGTSEVYNSLIYNNSASSNNFLRTTLGQERFIFPVGAGIFNESSGELVVVNSTISGNEGGRDGGGGILSEGKADIINSTIVENSGQVGAGIWAETETADVFLFNSLVAQNKRPIFDEEGPLYEPSSIEIRYDTPDLDGFFRSDSGYNFIGYGNGVLVDGVNGNIARTNIGGTQPVDIGLQPLDYNGGNTRTHALSADSLAIDAGSNTIFGELVEGIGLGDYYPTFNLINDQPTDQRFTETTDGENIIRTGYQRIANGTVDIGAFEYNSVEIQEVIDTTEPDPGPDPGPDPEPDPDDIERDNHPLDGDISVETTESNSENNQNSDNQTNESTSNFTNQNENTTNTSNETLDILDASEESNPTTTDPLSLLDMELFRWQNGDRPGTYLYANEEEGINIAANFPNFNSEGFAFRIGMNEGDNLTAFYRFHNDNVPGTYLYANATERLDILANYGNFTEEGLAFYAYDGNADIADDVYRLHNNNQPGTYLFVGAQEKDQILATYDNYVLEGVAFEAPT